MTPKAGHPLSVAGKRARVAWGVRRKARGAVSTDRATRRALPMDAAHQRGEHDLLGRCLVSGRRCGALAARLLAAGGTRIREQLVRAVQDVVDRLRVDRIEDLPERAERGRDPLRAV